MTKKQKTVLYRIIASAILILGISILCEFADVNIWGQVVLYLIPYFVIGYDILRKAFKGILNKQVFDENFLMAIATVGAMLLGEFKEGVAVMLFYQIGELFQSCAVGKSRRNIAALMDIRPDYANIIVDGQIEQVDPDDVEIGTEIVVNPGEKVPIDGIITEGNTTLNTSALTGESVPRDAKAGEEVISGCINMTGAIKLKTTKEFGDSTVSKILDLVENSSMKKSRSENFITKFARYYTPAVCYGALALAILPPIVRLIMGMSPDFPDWIIRALTFLVISCPCALVISIPLSFFGGIGCASSNGILVKGSNYLEELSKTKYIVFDKTGTLTEGHPTATGWLWAQSQEPHFKDVLLAAEMKSEHPLAGAIVSALQDEEKIKPAALDSFESITGKGIKASYEGHTYWVGSHKLLKDFSATVSDVMAEMLVHYESDGNGIIYFGRENELLAIIAVSDPIKATSAEAVKELKRQGIDICMLTGDGQRTALAVSSRLGIERFVADALPDDKAEFVRELQMQGKKVAMVGDGINDSQALALADVSIAMGKGTDIAMDVAMVTLMTSDLLLLPKAFQLSKQTVKLIHQNLFWAFIYNLIGIPIAAGILVPLNGLLLNPMLASAAMAFSSVSVVLNSLSLGRK